MFRNRERIERSELRADALDCVAAGIEAAHPERVVRELVVVDDTTVQVGGETLDLGSADQVLVVGGGKASGTAAAALEDVLGEFLDSGAVVTDDPVPTERVTVLSGDHPTPSETGVESTRRVLELADSAGEDDVVLALITGGGSALLTAPAGDVSLDDLRALTDSLLQSGAAIDEINTVRKHVSAIKGGRLAERAAPATVRGLVFSDVVGNDLGTIASGPTAPDPTSYADALDVLDRYDISAPDAVRDHLEGGARGERGETLTVDSPALDRVENHVLADGLTAVEGAASAARERGYDPLVLSTRIRGEAREAAKSHAAIAEECRESGHPMEPPVALVSGGETTVTHSGGGSGGPNQEFALQVALDLEDSETVLASVDTDGIDGATDAAGGLVDDRTVEDADAAREALDAHDSHPFLADRDSAILTGPTGTNVNDLRVHLVASEQS